MVQQPSQRLSELDVPSSNPSLNEEDGDSNYQDDDDLEVIKKLFVLCFISFGLYIQFSHPPRQGLMMSPQLLRPCPSQVTVLALYLVRVEMDEY